MLYPHFFLLQESETLETQNVHLKAEIEKLECEKKRLMEVLSFHEPTCAKRMKTSDQMSTEGSQTEITSEMDDEGNFSLRIPVPSQSSTSVSEAPRAATNNMMEWKTPTPENSFSTESSEVFHSGASGSCGDRFSMGGSFLAKGPYSHSHLDLESRCIAL